MPGVKEEVVVAPMAFGKPVEVQKAKPAVMISSITPQRIVILPKEKTIRVFAPEVPQGIEITDAAVFDSIYASISGSLNAAVVEALS